MPFNDFHSEKTLRDILELIAFDMCAVIPAPTQLVPLDRTKAPFEYCVDYEDDWLSLCCF